MWLLAKPALVQRLALVLAPRDAASRKLDLRMLGPQDGLSRER
jgi:hypothetical protein